ncbi:hypothetical protein [Devosia sp. A449]
MTRSMHNFLGDISNISYNMSSIFDSMTKTFGEMPPERPRAKSRRFSQPVSVLSSTETSGRFWRKMPGCPATLMSASGSGLLGGNDRNGDTLPSQCGRHLNGGYPSLAAQKPSGRNPPEMSRSNGDLMAAIPNWIAKSRKLPSVVAQCIM